MKNFMKATWARNSNLDVFSSTYHSFCGAANKTTNGQMFKTEFDHNVIFDFIDPAVECFGPKAVVERLSMGLKHMFSEISPEKNQDITKLVDFFELLLKEDPVYAKEQLLRLNLLDSSSNTHRSDEDKFLYLDKLTIKLNEIYLEKTGDSPDYLWEASNVFCSYFKNSGVLSANNENALKDVMNLIVTSGLTKDAIASGVGFKQLQVFTYWRNHKEKILEDIKSGNTFFNSKNSEILHVITSDGNNDCLDLLLSADKDFFFNFDYNDRKNEKSWIFDSPIIMKEVILNKLDIKNVKGYSDYSLEKLINSYNGFFSVEDMNDISKKYVDLHLSGSIEDKYGTSTKVLHKMIERTLSVVKENPEDKLKLIQDILGNEYIKNSFCLLPSDSNLPSISFFNALYKETHSSGNIYEINNHLNFLVAADSVKSQLSNDELEKLKEIKDYAMNKYLPMVESINTDHFIVLVSLLYDESTKDRFIPIFENTVFTEELVVPGIIFSSKSKALSLNSALSSKDYIETFKEKILDIFILDENAFNGLRKANRNSVKNLITQNENKFTQMVLDNPEKYFDVIKNKKEISNYVFGFQEKNNAAIMEKVINVNLNESGVVVPKNEDVDSPLDFKI